MFRLKKRSGVKTTLPNGAIVPAFEEKCMFIIPLHRIDHLCGLESSVGGLPEQVKCVVRIVKSFIHQKERKETWGQTPMRGI